VPFATSATERIEKASVASIAQGDAAALPA
jgi:hypothetical protein